MRKTCFSGNKMIFWHITSKRLKIIPPGPQISLTFFFWCLQAPYKVWSPSEHDLRLNNVLLLNLKIQKNHRNPLKLIWSKNTSFTHWLITRLCGMIQLWSIPHSIAPHLSKKMRGRWTRSDKKLRQEARSNTAHNKKNTLYIINRWNKQSTASCIWPFRMI